MPVQSKKNGTLLSGGPVRNQLFFIMLTAAAVFTVCRFDFFLPSLESATTSLTLLLASLSGFSATYEDSLLTVDGFRMSFVSECTAIHFMLLFTIAVIFTPGKTIRCRSVGIVAGLSTIILVNSARLVLLGVVGSRTTKPTFDIIHDFIFQILMAMLVLAMWLYWSGQKSDSKRTGWCIAAIAFSALYLIVASQAGDSYLAALIFVTNKIFSGVGLVDIAAAMVEGEFSYLIKWTPYHISYRQDIISIVLLWGVFSASLWQKMTTGTKNIRPLLKGVTAGTIILIAMQLTECVGVGVLLRQGVSTASVVEYLLYVRFLFIGAPVLIWWHSEKRQASSEISTFFQGGTMETAVPAACSERQR